MNTSGLDIGKIKKLVLEKWRSAPELWPVKVMSLARLAELEKQYGGVDKIGGYFTCLRAIRGKTPVEMESLLGFTPGYFSSGVSIWKFTLLPMADQFELRGYTQLPGGNPFDGMVLRVEGASRPQFFGKNGEPLTYIPGMAVEQWEVRSGLLLPAVQMGRVTANQRFTNWKS